jgi:hypothetical protein
VKLRASYISLPSKPNPKYQVACAKHTPTLAETGKSTRFNSDEASAGNHSIEIRPDAQLDCFASAGKSVDSRVEVAKRGSDGRF